MPDKDKSAPSSEPTMKGVEKRLTRIEEHLKRQGKEVAQGAWRTIAIFGASIIMVAVGLWIERMVASPVGFMANYAFLLICGFGIMTRALGQYLKIKKSKASLS